MNKIKWFIKYWTYRALAKVLILHPEAITVWGDCSLDYEAGSYEEGIGSEWWFKTPMGEEFQTGRSDLKGIRDNMFFPVHGKLVFIPDPGSSVKAERDADTFYSWCEEEGNRLAEEYRRRVELEQKLEAESCVKENK